MGKGSAQGRNALRRERPCLACVDMVRVRTRDGRHSCHEGAGQGKVVGGTRSAAALLPAARALAGLPEGGGRSLQRLGVGRQDDEAERGIHREFPTPHDGRDRKIQARSPLLRRRCAAVPRHQRCRLAHRGRLSQAQRCVAWRQKRGRRPRSRHGLPIVVRRLHEPSRQGSAWQHGLRSPRLPRLVRTARRDGERRPFRFQLSQAGARRDGLSVRCHGSGLESHQARQGQEERIRRMGAGQLGLVGNGLDVQVGQCVHRRT